MTHRPNDTLLRFGAGLALGLKWLSGLAGGIVALLVPLVLLINFDLVPDLAERSDFPLMESSPLAYLSLPVMLAAVLAALFLFFDRMRAIIESVWEGDPFIAPNADRLGAMAWLLLAIQLLAVSIGMVRLYLANLVNLGDESVGLSIYDMKGLLVVLVLFILARVFRQGTAMRDDLAGTV